ncbi:hypothetical protein [Acinetobacter sp.]|uniref:hypothetical protein n=1 Tax=Acinetobacter sp. TaxID=472 RepID=UPI0028A8B8E5|nr:hypothetical protein [Acinetobacter sp.]
MKFIVAVILSLGIAALVYYFNSPPSTTTNLPASTVAVNDGPKAYLTASYKMNVDGRDFSLKMVYDFPNSQVCEAQLNSTDTMNMISTFKQRCSSDSVCKEAEISSCSSFTDQKYKDMLDKKYHDTHYIYLSDSKLTDQRGVIVFWGLNEQESEKMCDYVKKSNRTINPINIECL